MTRFAESGDRPTPDRGGGSRRAIGRRDLLVSTGLATAGAALAIEGTAVAEPAGALAGALSEAVTVVSVGRAGRLLVRRMDGRTAEVLDRKGRERWQPGDEAVLDRKRVGDRWRVVGVSRLYRPILDERVTGRSGDVLTTESGTRVVLTAETRFRPDRARGYPAARPEAIRPGVVISGMSYLDSRSGHRVAVDLTIVGR